MDRGLKHVLAASLVSGGLLAASAWLFGCGQDDFGCTLLAGQQGLDVVVVPSAAGSYDIVVRSTEVEADCKFTVGPNLGIEWGPCRTRVGTAYGGYSYSADSAPAVLLNGERDVPRELAVQVFDANATLLVETTLHPQYSESYPNGRQCDPVPYRYASETVVVPAPR